MLNGVYSYRPMLACFRRTSFPVQSVWSIIYPEREFTQTWQAAYWRETIQMPFVQLRLPKERCPERAPPHTLWWAYLQLSSYSLHIRVNSFQNVMMDRTKFLFFLDAPVTEFSWSSLCLYSTFLIRTHCYVVVLHCGGSLVEAYTFIWLNNWPRWQG